MAGMRRLADLLQVAASPQIPEPASAGAPIKGWNTRDAFESMDPLDAVTLDNFQPSYQGVVAREGSDVYGSRTDLGPVSSLLVWRRGVEEQLLAAADDRIWLASAPDQTELGAGFKSPWWNGTMFNGRLLLANGRDPVQVYDGTTLAQLSIDVDPNPVAGSPIYPPFNPTAIVGLAAIHNLLFLWDGVSPGFWYGNAPYAFQGPILHWFPFDMVTPDNANLLAVNQLAYDGGTGIRSYVCFFLSTSEMLIYTGTTPDIPLSEDPVNGWSLMGIYTVAQPAFGASVTPRAQARYGGDLYMVTSSDYVKLSQLIAAVKAGQMPPRSKASGACLLAVERGQTLNGWQIVYWGKGRRLIVNVPLAAPDPGANNSRFEQHVYATGLDGWSRYRGLNAYCWCVWNDRVFFGTEQGTIIEFGLPAGDRTILITPPWNTTSWNTTPWLIDDYRPISAYAVQAPQLFGSAHLKRVAAVRPVVRSGLSVAYTFGLGFDYDDPLMVIDIAQSGERTPWNVTPWGSPWERAAATDTLWQVAQGDGSAISIGVSAQLNSPQSWVWTRTDFRIAGGIAL